MPENEYLKNRANDRTAPPASLSRLLCADSPSFLMEAHDGLSATIAREAGFPALWASGLTISSSLGYRDCNEASWTTVTEVVERIVDSSGLPVLVDGDSGFGSFNNARLLACKLRQRGAQGLCLEDKLYPKMNSFMERPHPLAQAREFSGRLQAVKDTAPDLILVARTEALIAGQGMDEALTRANTYADAGADAILVHSKRRDAAEIEDFMRQWHKRLPVVVVPTTYFTTPTSLYREMGVSVVIWANHSLRAAAAAMRRACAEIKAEESVASVEATIAPLADLFDLMDYDELAEAERRYLG
ncbi:isocitrate lyase/phosphoenolpyruvate mutase family protein [Rhizobium calliandrae]|uniref:Isocitrate lyase/phosphoenolpyruvate mutase family protein n=1 Tax=Rhizobium calliandrae TaxID=1312182 RepID=A0ABT7KMW7_9HYPH|nr:isocitrate lyase/phosphoenolpyruvate mutase family protein [Rhizobium calliandrae]MDL2408589.1 isocitrate lyase/phosphoenolpyruvate mutase family protein [Rhizobium calliandrae]